VIPVHYSFASEVEALFPIERCCNCGNQGTLQIVETHVLKTVFLGGGGYESTLALPLPYCNVCEVTAQRLRTGPIAKALLALLVAMLLMLVQAFAEVRLPFESAGSIFLFIYGVSVAIVFGAYRLRRRRGTQTTWYQPVQLIKMKQRFLDGTVTGLVLGFSNPGYRRDFEAVNATAIAKGVLQARPG
jgi:hypothetical protein